MVAEQGKITAEPLGLGAAKKEMPKNLEAAEAEFAVAPEPWSTQPKHIVAVLLKRLMWRILCLRFSVVPLSLDFKPLFICLIVAMAIQYLKR